MLVVTDGCLLTVPPNDRNRHDLRARSGHTMRFPALLRCHGYRRSTTVGGDRDLQGAESRTAVGIVGDGPRLSGERRDD